MNAPTALRRVERVRHELKRRELTVQAVEAVTPHFRRITLVDDSLSDFVSASFDDHVKVFIGDARRDYTPRSFDNAARELVIEFALHGDGPAADIQCPYTADAARLRLLYRLHDAAEPRRLLIVAEDLFKDGQEGTELGSGAGFGLAIAGRLGMLKDLL